MANSVTIHGTEIKQNEDGLISLTDVWKASGQPASKKPSEWFRSNPAQEIVKQSKRKRGRNGGTYADKTTALAYIEWLTGAAFYEVVSNSFEEIGKFLEGLESFEVPDEIQELYEEQEETLYVYAIREESTGNIKLGLSKNPEARLYQLQTGNSSRLALVGTRVAVDGASTEAKIHKENAQHHIHGEWFDSNATLEGENG